MNAMHSSSEIAQTAERGSVSMVDEGPFESFDPPQPNLADIGRLPATIMVPPPRSGMFAVIQVDAREVRLLVARLASDGAFRIVSEERESFASAGAPTVGEEQRRVAIAMAEILIRFQRAAELRGAAIRAVATQAFRTLPNHQHLLKRLPRVTRVALEVISDREAARLVCLGALSGRPPGHRTLVVDVAEETTSLILADGEQPLALWRLAVGTGCLMPRAGATGGRDRLRAASWKRQLQQALALAHLHAARGAAGEAVLIRPRELNPATASGGGAAASGGGKVAYLVAITFVEEIASYLHIRRVQATEAGLHDGILRELSRGLGQGPLTPGVAVG